MASQTNIERGEMVLGECGSGRRDRYPRCGALVFTTHKTSRPNHQETWRTTETVITSLTASRIGCGGMRLRVWITVWLLLVGGLLFSPSFVRDVSATTFYVGGGGPGNYTTIQEAIDAANAGDTVYVYGGTYYENLIVDKRLSLTGESKNSTTIDGSQTGDVIYVSSDGVNITDFTLTGSGWTYYDAGLELDRIEHCHVADNNISDSWVGILLNSSNNNTILRNSVSYNLRVGISLIDSDSNMIAGNSASNNTAIIYLTESSNNNSLTGNVAHDNERGIYLVQSDENFLRNNTILTTYREGIMISMSEGNIIEYNTVSSSNTDGIWLVEASNSTLTGNNVSHSDWVGISIWSSYNITLTDNHMTQNGVFLAGPVDSWTSHIIDTSNKVNGKPVRYWKNAVNGTVPLNAGQVILANCTGVLVENQNISGSSPGMQLGYSSHNTLANNSAFSNHWAGFFILYSNDNYVTNNTASSNSWAGIWVSGSARNTLTDNTLISNSNSGIELIHSTGHLLAGNVMTGDGIEIYGSAPEFWNTHSIDTSNAVNGRPVRYWKNRTGGTVPPGAGQVILASCIDVVVEKQNISNTQRGIDLGFSSGATIVNNDISNSGRGIGLIFSDDNEVYLNSLSNNGIGINVEYSDGNRIYHNVFMENQGQARTENSDSEWDDGYPSGGNYWSDYAWTDVMSGPAQDQPGSDGIGDIPRGIWLDEEDRYPLMTPKRDRNPPEVKFVLINGLPSRTYVLPDVPPLTLTAVLDDTETGDHTIDGANFTIGIANWSSSTPMEASDGQYDSSLEVALAEIPVPNGSGSQDYCVYSWDRGHNFNTTSVACARLILIRPPSHPEMLDASLSGPGLGDITLSWSRSQDDGAGENDVARYDVHRSTNYEGAYQIVGNVFSDGSSTYEWTCTGCGEGDSNDYFFYVVANDSVLSTPSPNKAAKFTSQLSIGPSLASFPLIQTNESIAHVLRTACFDMAWSHDSFDGKWKSYATGKVYRTLHRLDHSMGIWMNVTQDSNLTVAGIVPAQTEIQLHAGWTLVSFPSFSSYTVVDLKTETGATRVEGFDATPPYFLRVLADGETLQAGYGYWVKVDSDVAWVVENS